MMTNRRWGGLTGMLLAGLCLVGVAPVARGEVPVLNQEFLDAHLPEMQALAEAGSSVETALEAADMLRRILLTRTRVRGDLYQIEPEGSLPAIATLDAYDDQAVLALYAVTSGYVARETSLPPEEYLIRFQNLTLDAPDLGESPLGFMVLGLTAIYLSAADSLAKDPELDPRIVAKTTVQMTHLSTDQFYRVHNEAEKDPTLAGSTSQFYRSSVILRLRCPKDNGPYDVTNMKNRVDDSGDIYNLIYLACSICGETRVVEFRQELLSRLHRMTDRQNMEAVKKRSRSTRGVDP